jgi:hypothetical protein
MAGMRELLGGGLRPPSRLDGRRTRRRSGGDEVDIDDPVVAPKAVDHRLGTANKLLTRASLATARPKSATAWYRSIEKVFLDHRGRSATKLFRANL